MRHSQWSSEGESRTDLALEDHRGLHFDVAGTEREVRSAWRLLYHVYHQAGFIDRNEHRLHAVPEAIGPHAVVMLGRIGMTTVNTISSIVDSGQGLPLDSVYGTEMDEIRRSGGAGRRLVEIGLFADRRAQIKRSFSAAMELTRYAYWFGRSLGATDFVCGIPPRRVRMYRHAFGFTPIGSQKSYAALTDSPVQLMHVKTEHLLEHYARYRGIKYFHENPVSPETFSGRFRFEPENLAASPIQDFLREKVGGGPHRRAC